MKDIVNKIVVIVIFGIIIIGMFFFFLKKPTIFSENENRYLSAFPRLRISSLVEGNLTNDIEDYINDQFPFRDVLVGFKTKIEVLLGKTKINDIYIGHDEYLIPTFNKTNDYDHLLNVLNDFVFKSQVPVELILAPNAIEIYKDKLPINNEINDGIKEINKIYNDFIGTAVVIYDELLAQKDVMDLYYRTDHHWTTHGAFYAYNKYLQDTNRRVKDINDYYIHKVSDFFYGTSYSKANYYSIAPDDIYLYEDHNTYSVKYVVEKTISDSLYNFEYLDKKDKYSIFLDNNHALIEIDNLNNNSNQNLLLIKNSYGNSFAPFVVGDYDNTSIIDLRYYKDDVTSYIQENNITNVLILYDINGIYTDASIFKLR